MSVLRLRLVGCLLPALVVAGSAGLLRAEPPRLPATTLLEQGPLGRATLVILATVDEVRDVVISRGGLGQQIVFLRVERTFKGDAAVSARVPVRVVGHRPTLDPTRPSIPYFKRGVEGRFVLFLGQREEGHAYDLQELYGARGMEGDGRIEAVAAAARFERLLEPTIKGRATLAWILEALDGGNPWLVGHAARDAHHLLGVLPRAFDAAARARLTRLATTVRNADARWWLGRLVERLQADALPQEPGPALDAWQRAFLALATTEERRSAAELCLRGAGASESQRTRLQWLWLEAEPSLRRFLVDLSVDLKLAALLAHWRARYPGEDDAEVRESIVRAVGALGGQEDVAWLLERTRNPLQLRSGLLALARIGGAAATQRIQEVAAALEAGEPAPTGVSPAWVRWLLSPEFRESERRGGR